MIDVLADVRTAAALNVLIEGLVTNLRTDTVIGALPRVMFDVDDDMEGGVAITMVADVMSIALEFAVSMSYVVDAVADVMIGGVPDLTVDVLVNVSVKMLLAISTPLAFATVPSEEAIPFP